MSLLNVAVVSAQKGHVPLTVVQVQPGLTFVQLFQVIVAGAHPMLSVDAFQPQLKRYNYIGQSRESLSVVDEKLVIDDVCSIFGQCVKYVVAEAVEPEASTPSTLKNALTILMNSQRTATDSTKLPSKKQERNKKDQLFNDIVSLLERNDWTWNLEENHMESSL